MSDKLIKILDGSSQNLPLTGSEQLKAGRFFVTTDFPNEAIYYCPEDGRIIQLGGGVGKKTAEGGEIFNDYNNNIAIGVGSSARGLDTQAGNKGYKILNIEKIDNTSHEITVRGDAPYAIDDILQLECATDYNNRLKITNIEVVNGNSIITVAPIDDRVFNNNIQMYDPTGQDIYQDWAYVVGKDGEDDSRPECTSVFTAGKNSKATGYAAAVFGRNNIASGSSSLVSGIGNIGGYASLMCGENNEAGTNALAIGHTVRALGDSSVATGVKTYAKAASSRAGGRESEALSEFTVAEGLGVIAGSKQGQVVHGKYNVRNDSDLFIIGDGSAKDKRHNAFRITSDYKVFLNNNAIELANVGQVNNLLKGSVSINSANEVTGELALATGKNTHAKGQGSTAICIDTVAEGQGSFAAGIDSHAEGYATIALGNGVKTMNSAPVYGQMAVGKFNEVNYHSLFMVGNGTSDTDRKNIFEVRTDGSAKISNSLILTDRTTGKEYKIYINDGKLQLEEVTA